MTRDELKALWAELGENHYNHRIGDYANEIPPGPPAPGSGRVRLLRSPRVHAMLETHIRGEHKALLANLRAFPPRGTDQRGLEPRDRLLYRKIYGVPGRGVPRPRSKSSSTPTADRASTARTSLKDGSLRVHPRLRPGRRS